MVLIIGWLGCQPVPSPSHRHPIQFATGKEYEVLITAPQDQLETVKKIFDSVFAIYYPMLNRPELWFSPVYIPLNSLQPATRYHHTIFVVWMHPPAHIPQFLADAVGDSTSHAMFQRPGRFYVFDNLWAQGQQVWWWVGNNPDQLYEMALKLRWQVIDSLDRHQARRITDKLYRNGWHQSFARKITTQWGYSLRIPTIYSIDKVIERTSPPFMHFFWARSQTKQALSNIIGWAVDTPMDSLDLHQFVTWHDTMGHRFIPGPSEGSYFATESRFIQWMPVQLSRTPAYEVRGFWRVEGDFMGGPYVAYIIPDSTRTIIIEGFLHAPGTFQKRFVKRLELILHSFQK